MQIDGAVIKEQGQKFAIAVVQRHALNSANVEEVRASYIPVFGNIPIILAAQDSRGVFTYHGRNDIVNFLANIHPSQIPWKTFTV